MMYRADVDGLRAMAIIPVVLYHAFGQVLPGGFVGVDVFFVISGFLITSLIKKEIESSQFSLIRFYERRARRILPALAVMMFIVIGVGLIALPPVHLEELAASAISATMFVSNVHFWLSIGYFSTDSEFWPLLHTWSLSVEEQFYLLHPLLVLLLVRFCSAKWRAAILFGSVLASLALCVYATAKHPSAAFYLLPFRYWELATGALCAFFSFETKLDERTRAALSALGLMLILLSALLYDESIPFPGYWATLPVAGTSLVIAFATGTSIARVLSTGPLVFIGLISYSLYLWHWPILAFARYIFGSPMLPVSVAAYAVVASILAAYVSWRFVEKPFRRPGFLTPKQVGVSAASMGCLTLAVGVGLISSSGLPQRLNSEDLIIADAIGDYRSTEHCWGLSPSKGLCRLGIENASPTLLVWGDSHAGALFPAFDHSLEKSGGSGVMATRGACAPLIGVRRIGYNNDQCVRFNDEVMTWLRTKDHGVKKVVLVARWNMNATGVRPQGEAGAQVRLSFASDLPPEDDQLVIFEYGLNETVRSLRELGLEVVLLDDTPEIGWNVPMATFLRSRLGLPAQPGPDRESLRAREAPAHRVMHRVASVNGASFISLNDRLCSPTCELFYLGHPIFADDDHISTFGAKWVIAPLLLDSGAIE